MAQNLTEPVKRTTLVVRDVEASLRFYRDLLGMQVFFDGEIGNPSASDVTGVNCRALRMVVLQVGDSQLGMVGLMQLLDPDPPLAPLEREERMRLGESILLIPTENMKLIHQKMVEQGFTVVRPPTRVEVPGRGEVHEMMSRDPDGQIVNLSQRGPLR
jgi:catechol 2,3-dioxygenase-like lactoylglutathione lyase family enzyme